MTTTNISPDAAYFYSELDDHLFQDVVAEEEFYNVKPLLAHYTSSLNLENILKYEEIWLSNPLFMNDYEEIRFGIMNGAARFKNNSQLRSAIGDDHHGLFSAHIDAQIVEFEEKHLLDVYIFCLSEHAAGDEDGLLSMWRGYGGNGKGAAIVFDTSKIDVIEDGQLVVAKVKYASTLDRLKWLDDKANELATFIEGRTFEPTSVWLLAYATFHRLVMFALFTKHIGFSEEREWRLVYLPNREGDVLLSQHYANSDRGVEPKLKFKFRPSGSLSPDFSLEKVVKHIIIGPSASSPLSLRSTGRMLEIIGQSNLKDRLIASTIPYRG